MREFEISKKQVFDILTKFMSENKLSPSEFLAIISSVCDEISQSYQLEASMREVCKRADERQLHRMIKVDSVQ